MDKPEAIEELYRQYGPGLVRCMSRVTGSQDLAEDIVQDTFTKCFLHYDKVLADGRHNWRGWLYTVAYNLMRSHFRHAGRHPTEPLPDRPLESLAEDFPDVDASLVLAEMVSRLSFDHQQAIVCVVMSGWTQVQFAETFGVKLGTVKSRTHRALSLLRSSAGQELLAG